MGLKITVCSWGKFWTQMIQRPKNPTVISEKLGAKTWVSEQKQTTAMPPALSITERWANHLSHPLAWPQIRNEITASHILRGTGAPLKPCLNLSALSCQFLLIGEGQEPWWVSLIRYPATIWCFANFSRHGSQKQKYFSLGWSIKTAAVGPHCVGLQPHRPLEAERCQYLYLPPLPAANGKHF